MPKHKIRSSALYLRTAHFTDGLLEETGLSAAEIERRVRKNQYDRYGLAAPEEGSVLDYFGLYRSIAFEPRENDMRAPWLLAAELEFPGCSFRYFHPLIDLMFGNVESAAYWRYQFRKIPEEWIKHAEGNSSPKIAAEWRAMNEAYRRRVHRKKRANTTGDQLTLLHLSMLRLPDVIRRRLFVRKGPMHDWERAYTSQPPDFDFLKEVPSADALAALIALTDEAARIGDMDRYRETRAITQAFLPRLKDAPACRRIHEQLSHYVSIYLENLTPRRYSFTLQHGFGAPASWRMMMREATLRDTMKRLEAVTTDSSV